MRGERGIRINEQLMVINGEKVTTIHGELNDLLMVFNREQETTIHGV